MGERESQRESERGRGRQRGRALNLNSYQRLHSERLEAAADGSAAAWHIIVSYVMSIVL